MRKLLLVTTGIGIGYVLGARAGRPAYDRLVENARQLGENARLDRTRKATRDVVSEAKHAGEQLRDKADSRIAETVDKVSAVIPTSTPTTTPTTDDGTVVLPDTSRATETRSSDMANGF